MLRVFAFGEDRVVTVRADAEGLRTLAQQLLELAEHAPDELHLTLASDDPEVEAPASEDGSAPAGQLAFYVEKTAAGSRGEGIAAFLRAHLGEEDVLAALAAELGVEKAGLAAVFRAEQLPAPQKYLARLRIERAGELLLENRETIGQIAQALGYADVAAFSHFFRKHTGKSPREYREALEWLQ